MKNIIILIVACFMVACQSKQPKPGVEKKTNLDRYIYEDRVGIVHTKSGCKAVCRISGTGAQPVTPIEIGRIISIKDVQICSQCVTADDLDSLHTLISLNDSLDTGR